MTGAGIAPSNDTDNSRGQKKAALTVPPTLVINA